MRTGFSATFMRVSLSRATEGGTGAVPIPQNETRRNSPAKSKLETLIGGADMRVKITLACTECKQRNYNTKKNKKNDPDRLEMNKYCKFCRKHTLHKETK